MSAAAVVSAVLVSALVALAVAFFLPTWATVSLVLLVVAILLVGGEVLLAYAIGVAAVSGLLLWLRRRFTD